MHDLKKIILEMMNFLLETFILGCSVENYFEREIQFQNSLVLNDHKTWNIINLDNCWH